jgi:two-component system, NarL family, captular synthesis response regulator RcsB
MNVILYDDHAFVLEAIARHASKPKNLHIVSQCTTVDETLLAIQQHNPDILIADVISSENSGTRLFDQVLSLYPKVKIVVYSTITNAFLKDCLIDMGISSVINKSASLDHLWKVVAEVVSDNEPRVLKPNILPRLTDREKTICDCLVKGQSVKDISKILGTSIHTISNQKKNLLDKFKCGNSTELITKLGQMGLISTV